MDVETLVIHDTEELSENNEKVLYYTNEYYKDSNWLNEQILMAKFNVKNNGISTAIIEHIYYYPYYDKDYQYHLSGIVVADEGWEYYSTGKTTDFYILETEAVYILKNKCKLYKYETDDYHVGTNLDMIE